MTARPWRFFRDGLVDGAGNMARDETLLVSVEEGAPPSLRLYGWTRPTLSLGAHQSAEDADLPACRASGVDLIRRPTGGGAVLHDAELTYSVTGRIGEWPFPSSVVALYEAIAAALISGLGRLGVDAESSCAGYRGRAPADCFGAPSPRELTVGGRKLVGSAQVRRRGAFLQHGSILLDLDAVLLARVLRPARGRAPAPGAPTTGTAAAGTEPHGSGAGNGGGAAHPAAATLRALLRREVRREEVEEAMAEGFRTIFGAELSASALDGAEGERAAQLRTFKYLDAHWTIDGKLRARAI